MSHDTKIRWSYVTWIVALDYFRTVLSDFRRSFIDEIKVNSCWNSQYGKQFFEVQIFCYRQAFSGQRFSISYQAPCNLHVGESNAPLIGQELILNKIFWRWKTSVNCLARDMHRALKAFPIRWKILVLISEIFLDEWSNIFLACEQVGRARLRPEGPRRNWLRAKLARGFFEETI